jgi:prefoldin subunit 5
LSATSTLLVIASTILSGCVVGEIRDEMVTSNASISDTNLLLEGIRSDIDQTNQQLVALAERMDRNENYLKRLETIDTSLKALDAHLASLRATLENIDSTIPFLSFADRDDEEATTQPATQPETQPASQSESQPERTDSAPPASSD